jgi:hypothetical protein
MDPRITEIEKMEQAVWPRVRRWLAWVIANFGPALAVAGVLVIWGGGHIRPLERGLADLSLDVAAVERREPTVAKYLSVLKALAETRASKLGADECAEIGRAIVEGCSANKDVGLTEAIVFGLIERESDFDPMALSDAHAYGMGQLLWGTAAPHYRDLGFANLTADLLFNPVLNVEASIRELVRLRRTFLAVGVDSWYVTLTAYYYGEKIALMLLNSKTLSPSLEYGSGVMSLARKWKERGL